MGDRDYSLSVWLKDFPAGLDTKTDPTDLKDGSTPAAYGLDLDVDQRLAAGSVPVGTARTAKTFDNIEDAYGNTNTYYWYYNRLWRWDDNDLYWGAQGYDNYFYPVGRTLREFSETATDILTVLPYGEFQLAVFKADCTYVVSNIQDTRDLTFKTDCYQEISIADASHAVELDGVVYASTSTGLKAFTGTGVKDLTRSVRDGASAFSGKELKADYNKKRIIGTDAFVYDVESDRLFDYTTSGFLWTSPALRTDTFAPFVVDNIIFGIEHTDEDDATFTYQHKTGDEDWSDEKRVYCRYDTEIHTSVTEYPDESYMARKFQIRITDMDDNIRIRNIAPEISGAAQHELTV